MKMELDAGHEITQSGTNFIVCLSSFLKVLDTPSVSNLHSSTDGSSQRCNSFCNDNKEENNNSNSGGGFSSRNSDDSSIFGGNYS